MKLWCFKFFVQLFSKWGTYLVLFIFWSIHSHTTTNFLFFFCFFVFNILTENYKRQLFSLTLGKQSWIRTTKMGQTRVNTQVNEAYFSRLRRYLSYIRKWSRRPDEHVKTSKRLLTVISSAITAQAGAIRTNDSAPTVFLSSTWSHKEGDWWKQMAFQRFTKVSRCKMNSLF